MKKWSRTISRVLFPLRGDHHSSRTGIAPCLKQPTRKLRPGRPQTFSYLVLLRTGFAELAASPRQLVGSYPTFSPLPRICGAVCFCGTGPRSPPLDVIQCPALWSPDFPPPGIRPATMICPTPKLCKVVYCFPAATSSPAGKCWSQKMIRWQLGQFRICSPF